MAAQPQPKEMLCPIDVNRYETQREEGRVVDPDREGLKLPPGSHLRLMFNYFAANQTVLTQGKVLAAMK